MNIRLVDSTATSYNQAGMYYDLPSNFIFNGRTITQNTTISENAFKNGGKQTGNNNIQSRQISIRGRFKKDSSLNADEKINEFLGFIIRHQPLKLYVIGDTLKYLDGVYFDNTQISDFIYTEYIEKEIALKVEYPFWILDTKQTAIFNAVSSGDTFTLTNNTDYPVYPIITIEAVANMTYFKLKNQTNSNISTNISDPIFTTGQEITIDCIGGTITKAGNTMLQYFSGSFWQILPGANTILYTAGADANITVEWNYEELK